MLRVVSSWSSTCIGPFLCLLICCCLGKGGAGDGWRSRRPEFGTTLDSVRVREGETAKLPCVVLFLNDRAVTWLRRRDLHILTIGHHTYSADERFQVVHRPGSDQWTLVVRFAQVRDSGAYECQVNTDPKISRPVVLDVYNTSQPISVTKTKVFVANNTASTRDGHLRVEVLGPRERYIEEGSSLTLSCLVTSSFGPSTLVYWYHDTRLIDYTSARGGIKLKIDHERGETTARLLVETVGVEDSGMYSCVPSGSHPASVRVHVQQGEQEAAIQQGGLNVTSLSVKITPLAVLPCLLPLVLLCIPPVLLNLSSLSHDAVPLLACIGLCVSSTQAYTHLVLDGLLIPILILLLAKGTQFSLLSPRFPLLKSLGWKAAAISFPPTSLFHISSMSHSSNAPHTSFHPSLLVLILTLRAFHLSCSVRYFQLSYFMCVITVFLHIFSSHIPYFLLLFPILVYVLCLTTSLYLSLSLSNIAYLFPASLASPLFISILLTPLVKCFLFFSFRHLYYPLLLAVFPLPPLLSIPLFSSLFWCIPFLTSLV